MVWNRALALGPGPTEGTRARLPGLTSVLLKRWMETRARGPC